MADPHPQSILAITSEMPWPLDSGGHLRTYHLLRQAAARCRVRLLMPHRGSAVTEGADALRRAGIEPCLVAAPPRTAIREGATAFACMLAREPYVMFARHHAPAVQRALHAHLRHDPPHAIYCDHLDSFAYTGAFGDRPLIVDMHNVYSRLASRAAEEQPSVWRRRYLRREAHLLARMEETAARTAHTVMAVSADEARYFASRGADRVVVVPNGVDCAQHAALPLADRPSPPTIMYLGSYNWPPNVAAVRFLARHVLPELARTIPGLRLLIIGKDPGSDVRELAADPRVTVAGNVHDLAPYWQQAHVLAVPLEAGGGTRLKILEAFAAGVPVVSTAIGCEGLEVVSGRHLVIAERAEFAAALSRLLEAPARARAMATQARLLARYCYDWTIVGAAACDAIMGATPSRRPAPGAPSPVPLRVWS